MIERNNVETENTCTSDGLYQPPTNKVFNVSYGSISCILWNINGLKSKWDNDDLRIYLQQYDFIFLTETWATAKDTFSLKDYESY